MIKILSDLSQIRRLHIYADLILHSDNKICAKTIDTANQCVGNLVERVLKDPKPEYCFKAHNNIY